MTLRTIQENPIEPEFTHVSEQETLATPDVSISKRLAAGAKYAGQTAVVFAEVSPLNEALRLSAFGAGELLAHSPVVGAVTLGGSALIIEGVAAVSAASLLSTKTNEKFNGWLREKMTKLGYDEDSEISPTTYAASTLLGGSVVSMALHKFANPDTTVAESRRFGLKNTVLFAGASAVAGALGSEGIDVAFHNPVTTGVVAGAAVLGAGAKKVRSVASRKRAEQHAGDPTKPNVWLDHHQGIEYGLAQSGDEFRLSEELENDVWHKMGYGDINEEGYGDYIKNSRTFVAFKGDKCIGVNRMFNATDTMLPPFLGEKMPFYSEEERDELADQARDGDIEELGTVAVDEAFRGAKVNLRLWRLAYRDARARGIKYWGIIMEPERVEKMNKHHGFTFRQLGETVDYQGGECAAHIMNLEEVDQTMKKQHPIEHFWFVRKKIRP